MDETVICDLLVADLCRLHSFPKFENFDHALDDLPEDLSPTVEAAILRAATHVRFHAKWFKNDGLVRLLDIALQAASRTSSADLHAALTLVDNVGIYTAIPPESLPIIARFLAQAYYSASRAQKTKNIANLAWRVTLNILTTHLGKQLMGELFGAMLPTIPEDDRSAGFASSQPEDIARATFACSAGCLMLLEKRLNTKDSRIPPVNHFMLIERLCTVARYNTDTRILERVASIFASVIATEGVIPKVCAHGGEEIVLNTARLCCRGDIHIDMGPTILRLAPQLLEGSPYLIADVARLLFAAKIPLNDHVRTWLTAWLWPLTMQDKQSRANLSELLTIMCAQEDLESSLEPVLRRGYLAFRLEKPTSLEVTSTLVETYNHHIESKDIGPEPKNRIGNAIAALFLDIAGSPTAGAKAPIIFEALCNASTYSPHAAGCLFCLRADVTGALYLFGDDESEESGSKSMDFASPKRVLDLDKWHAVLLMMFGGRTTSWKVLDCFLKNTKHLLGNHAFFARRINIIMQLQKLIRDNLESGVQTDPPPYTGYGKPYVATQLVQTLTACLSYHRQLPTKEVVGIVSTLLTVAGSRDYQVSIQCIHALTICCYELPDIMVKYMDDVIDKMARLVTQRYLAIHVLQFLAGLSRLENLYRNFTDHNYKKIFAVCYTYLQASRGQQSVAERKQTPTSEQTSSTRNEEALPEYVYALAHHVITFWYLSLEWQNRSALKPYITNCLTFEVDGKMQLEEQGMVTIDMMDRVDAEDGAEDLTSSEEPFTAYDGRLVERNRVVGLLLVSTKTSLRTGKTLVIVRRPSGTTRRLLASGRSQVTVENSDGYLTVVPGDDLGRTYGTISVPKSSSALGPVDIIDLPEDDAVRRAIEILDRTSALDSHKAGVIYIDERQTTEERIFLNMSGSPDYREFVQDLGQIERLKGAKFNTQGLDTADGTDGEFAKVWRNDVTELVFHVTTLMPNSIDHQENTTRKKAHVGNDHVNIIFNNSGRPLDYTKLFNIFPGQLTFVYIVISPTARTSFVEARTENVNSTREDRFYRVEVVTRPDYPNISSAAEEKVVSGASLGGMVRNLALNECIMTLMWTERSNSAEYPSSWRSRMEQIRRLGERYKVVWK